MVLVVSLNSAVDKTLVVPGFAPGKLFRPTQGLSLAGGKGINVARVLKRLGVPVRVVGVVAGESGERIRRWLKAEGIAADWVAARNGESRICLAIVNGRGTRPTEINEPGPTLTRAEVAAVERKVRRLLPRARMLVLSGSLPPGVPADFYARLIAEARRRGVPTALDTSGPALAKGAAAGPTLVKINDEEAASVGLRTAKPAERLRALKRLMRGGASLGIITLGAGGLDAAVRTECGDWARVRATPPRIDALCAIGSGDTLLAGLAAGWLADRPLGVTLRSATALAAANALTLGAGVYSPAQARRLERRVALEAGPGGR